MPIAKTSITSPDSRFPTVGFRTLAIQKQSGAVWKILEAVKAEFGEFSSYTYHTWDGSAWVNQFRYT